MNDAPAKARMRVLAMVPMASLPMFIPERKSWSRVILGSTVCSS